MEDPCETLNNSEAFHMSRYHSYNNHSPRISSPWLDLRVFYVRISNVRVEDSTPEALTINHIPLDPDTLLEINGVRMSMYSEGCSSQLRRDRVDKKSEEATYVSTDNIRLNGSVKFEVYDKKELVLSGFLEMSDGNGFTGESKKQWNMTCEAEITVGSGFVKEKSRNGQELLPALPTIEVYVTGCFSGTPIILTKTLQLGLRKKQSRRMALDSIPEYETAEEPQKDISSELDLQAAEYANYKDYEGDRYWRSECLDGEMSWFNAGVRVGVGIGLGACVGIGIGVGLLDQILSSKRINIMRCYNNYSTSILLFVMLMLILASNVVTLSSLCQTESCGSIKIPYPFGVREGCYLNEWYKIECRNNTFPFLFKMGLEVVNFSFPRENSYTTSSYPSSSYGSIRIKSLITSVGCSRDGKDSGLVLNLTDSPFFFEDGNSLVAVGCNGKASLTNIEPTKVGCELNCTASKERLPSKSIPFFDNAWCSSNPVCTKNKGEDERRCDGNGCCEETLEGFQDKRVMGVRIESFEQGNSTFRKCRVALLTDEVYMLSNATKPESFFSKGYATVRMGWIIQTNNLSYIKSLGCETTKEYQSVPYSKFQEISCICYSVTTSGTSYANCGCNQGYTGNPYLFNGCKGQ
ncbi:BnaA06g38500D [Brassica napus]|uniref:(rape) hypothetical protein n=1 Tax=Brassica napus TaxID=3708 RepID=A0A078JKT4_BRANA|nr:unnamed protein product [Brassica napus]CDY67389.1 BnaA06g38500D [Brassica napus]